MFFLVLIQNFKLLVVNFSSCGTCKATRYLIDVRHGWKMLCHTESVWIDFKWSDGSSFCLWGIWDDRFPIPPSSKERKYGWTYLDDMDIKIWWKLPSKWDVLTFQNVNSFKKFQMLKNSFRNSFQHQVVSKGKSGWWRVQEWLTELLLGGMGMIWRSFKNFIKDFLRNWK